MSHSDESDPTTPEQDGDAGREKRRKPWSKPSLTVAGMRTATGHSAGPIYTDGSFAPKLS